MQSEATRAAFTLSPIHQRRDQHRITSVAVLQHGSRVFLGLENGVLEEHSCFASTIAGGVPAVVAAAAGGMLVLRLLAEKKVFSKQAIADISIAEAAARLVCMSEEGQVALVSLETFAVVPLPTARGATAVAVQPAQHLPVLLAVAVKAGKGRSKVLVFNVLPGANVTGGHQPAVLVAQTPVPSTVLGLTWAGRSLLLAVPGGYQALTPVTQQQQHLAGSSSSGVSYQLTVLADHLHDMRTMLGCVTDLGLALMLWEENMVLVTDANGAAVREPLQLPLAPLALTAAGLFVVALCDDGIHVFDRSSSREVQHIDFAHDDAYAQMSQRLPAAADSAGKAIVVATSSSVFRLEPIAIEQQVRELLKRKRFDQALQLIAATPPEQTTAATAQAHELYPHDSSPSGGVRPCWQHIALAQAGLLLLLECEFESGLNVLEQLPVGVWQPCQLFSLFPGVTARWLSQVPDRSYWGLHGHHLPELQRLVTDMLELKAATAATYQQQHRHQHRSHHHQHQHTLSHLSSEGGSSSSLSSGGAAAAGQSGSESAEIQGLIQQAKTAVAGYLSRARSCPGVILLDAVDSLLLQLLCDVGDAAAVEALVSSSSSSGNGAVVSAATAALREAGRWHALALLMVKCGQSEEALRIWQSLSVNELTESPSTTGAVAAAGGNAAAVAVSAAAAAMSSGPDSVSLDLLLSGSLRWLLSCDAAASLTVLQARGDLDPQVVLKLLEEVGNMDLKWQYLYHQVHHSSSSSSGTDHQIHTKLATVLLAALASLITTSGSSSSSSRADATAAATKLTAEQLAAMVYQLPLLMEPNITPATDDVAAAGASAADMSSSSGDPMAQTSFAGLASPKPRGLSRLGNSNMMSSTAQHSRKHSMMGAGVPSALYFAASVAQLNARASRAQVTISGSSVPATQQLPQQQQQIRSQWQQQQPRRRQHCTSLGALAGDPVLPYTAAAVDTWLGMASTPGLYRQGTAAPTQLLNLSFPGLSSVAGNHNRDQQQASLVATQSNIAQVLLQQIQHGDDKVSSSAGNKGGSQQQGSEGVVKPGLRALPADVGPWPLQLSGEIDDSNDAGSSAAAGEQGDANVSAAAAAAYEKVLLLRCLLVYHLQASLVYDVETVLSAAAYLPLYPELALLYSRASNHSAALALLALFPPRLVEECISYCRALGSADAWLALLELFLNPKQILEGLGWLNPASTGNQNPAEASGFSDNTVVTSQGLAGSVAGVETLTLEPDYGSACRVLHAEGASLNPLRLLSALPADMPLHLAGGLLGSVVCGLQHRRRYGQVVRNLLRSRRLASHADLVQLQSARVFITDDTACNGCGRFLGSKVFYRYPSGVVVCSRCSGAVAAAGTSSSVSPVPGAASATAGMPDSSWELV